jgi:integrase
MASLQARHSRGCRLGKPWTPADKTDGCTCPRGPLFHVVVREGRSAHKTPAGRNRRQAERALAKLQVDVDEGVFQPQKNVRFSEWADRWIDGLEREPSTVLSYRATMGYAKDAFGDKVVRRVTTEDVKRFTALMRDVVVVVDPETKEKRTLSDSTRAKHLRVLIACLNSAIAHGYAARNVAAELPKGERPRARKRESAYFTNDEIPVLFEQFEEGVHRVLFLVALKTGMRLGELSALRWGDVDLLVDKAIRVRWSFTGGRVARPKNHEIRDVDLSADVVELLGEWWGELGKPADDKLVLPGATKAGYLNPQLVLRKELYPAMEAAGINRVGPTGEKRTFHSFRHTFAKRALENGRQITWLSRHLGHSSLSVTTEIYGHWERAERKREAEAMAGVFGV